MVEQVHGVRVAVVQRLVMRVQMREDGRVTTSCLRFGRRCVLVMCCRKVAQVGQVEVGQMQVDVVRTGDLSCGAR